MKNSQALKAEVFKKLHTAKGIFVMPNAWNAGSACLLESAGFSASDLPPDEPAPQSLFMMRREALSNI